MNFSEFLAATLEQLASRLTPSVSSTPSSAVALDSERPGEAATTAPDEIPAHIPGTYLYRTRDDRAWFRFSNVHGDGGLRVYVVSQPPYGGRATFAHTIHRLSDGEQFYICFSGTIATPEDAVSVAEQWAELTWRYITTGRSFEDPLP